MTLDVHPALNLLQKYINLKSFKEMPLVQAPLYNSAIYNHYRFSGATGVAERSARDAERRTKR